MKQQIQYTDHAKRRMAQRAVTKDQVILVLRHAKKIHRQGFLFHIMRDKDLPKGLDAQMCGRVKRLVVVTTPAEEPTVITAYRSQKALKRIKCKSKVLL
ncbi:MAG: DUF4258 domain-containing protein [Balneolaceae bacterium]|nr:DUF4258 domain-containing protein [Balneolaceae bacterium]